MLLFCVPNSIAFIDIIKIDTGAENIYNRAVYVSVVKTKKTPQKLWRSFYVVILVVISG